MTLLGGPRRGYVPVRRRNPSGGLQSSRQISPSDGTRHRQLRDRDRQAEEEDGEAGMTEAGVTEAGQSKTSPDLYYNGGPVIADPVVYLIYYGTWPENSGAAIIDNFVQSLGGNASRQGGPRGESSVSGWWAITTHYFMTRADRKLAYVTPKVRFGGSVVDQGSIGHSFSDTEIARIVDRNVGKANFVDRNVGKANRLPSDPNGIYIVVTSADVDVWEFSRCSYCGWHAQMMDMRTGSPIVYAFVGHHSLCCQYSNSSPNGLPAIDSMVSTIAHEITEAAADPSCLLNPRISLPPPCPSNPTPSHPGRSSPTGLPAIDSMVSTIAHETTEATTDSSPNGMPAIDSMLCRPKLSRPKLCCPKLCRSKLRCSKLCCPKLCRPKLRCSKLCRPELCRPKLCCP
ncbi:unnamed protein product [Closterium sp. Naga37s-1]|nr:unnamed protein product [Closterium sp. Naga37s-1]